MKVLHLTNKPIFPLVDGGCIAMHAFLKNMLHLGFEVKNLTIATSKHPFDLSAFPARLREIILPEAGFINTTVHAKDAFLSFFNKKSYNVSRFYDRNFELLLIEKLSQADYGLVVLESAYLLPYLAAIRKHFKGKVLLRAHNVEFRIWERLAEAETSIFKRIFLKKLARDLKQYELKYLKATDGIACISDADKEQFKALGIKVPMCTIPVSMDFTPTEPLNLKSSDFFFLGSMNWQPNIEAVDFLLKEIFPQIQVLLPEARLHLAGSFMPEKLLKLNQKNVTVHGKVADVKDFMSSSGILIVPLKSGSGIRIKILEALASGVPVIATSVGFEGIPVKHEVHGLIADSSEAIAQSAIRLSKDPQFAAEMAKNGQKMALSTYSKENVSNKLLEFIQSI